ncbi:hypothetical protein [Glutamicibacter ardleyensis]|uniref:hypothetical protein n=1 Tax=Glutamicibacter ardleyensis TaxID=225894 RepID=UPI003FD31B81
MKILRTFIASTGILVIMGTTAVLPANAATNDSIYNQLSVVRNQAGKPTPVNDTKLRTLAGDRAKTLASKDSSSASPTAGLPNSMYSTGYKQSSQLWGYHSSGDSQDVVDSFIKSQKSTITNSQWNRLGVGQAKSKSGKIYVVAILGEYKAPVSVKPAPAPSSKPKPKPSTGGGSGSSTGSNGNTNNGTKPTAGQSKAEKELAELKAKQKKDAENRAKQEAEAKKKSEQAKKQAETEAKAKAEQEKKDAETRKQQEAEAKKQAEAEKVEREKQEVEKQAEIERLAIEKQEAQENSKTLRATLHKITSIAGGITTSLGTLLLPLAFLLTRKRKFARVPKDSEFEQFKKDYLANH